MTAFDAPSSDLAALIETLQQIQPTGLSLHPRSIHVTGVLVDVTAVHDACIAFIGKRMDAVQRHTGVDMEVGPRIGDLEGIFTDSIRPQFYVAEREVDASTSGRRAA